MGKFKKKIWLLIPPVVILFYNKFFVQKKKPIISNDKIEQESNVNNEIWKGIYNNWEFASGLTEGYDHDIILQKCYHSILKVKNGDAVYERDSILFDKKQYSTGVLAGLFLTSICESNRVSVMDFGGSLGSTYFQNIEFFKMFDEFHWGIVEQSNFYELGLKYFEDEQLTFHKEITDCIHKINPNVLLISSSLQYISNPEELLETINFQNIRFIIFDRTSISLMNNFITIQRVPDNIYKGSYPTWIFNFEWILSKLSSYKFLFDFPSYCDGEVFIDNKIEVKWRGFVLEKNNSEILN